MPPTHLKLRLLFRIGLLLALFGLGGWLMVALAQAAPLAPSVAQAPAGCEHQIIVAPGAGGSITPNTGFFACGSNVVFTITPSACTVLESVYVDGSPVMPAPNIYTFTNVSDNHILTATFAPRSYRIIPLVTGNGLVTPSTAITAYYGITYPFTLAPNIGSYLAQLSINGQLTTPVPVYTFSNVCSNKILAANFVTHTYNITATTGPNGTIAPAGVSTVTYGSNKVFTITPNPYYHIENLWVDGVLQPYNQVSTLYTFTNILTHHTLSVTFAPDPTMLDVNVVNSDTVVQGGIVLPGGVICTVNCPSLYYGSPTVTATATVNGGKLLHWGGACNGTNPTCAVQMVTTRTITAYFGLHRLYLPFMTQTPPCRSNPSETEPNNAIAEANGPLCSGLTYTFLPNDYQDWFYFDIPNSASGPVAITMTNNSAWGGQLQLRDGNNNLLGYSLGPGVFQITCANYITPNCTPGTPFAAGRYYIVVFVNNNHSTTPYKLTVTYPGPVAP